MINVRLEPTTLLAGKRDFSNPDGTPSHIFFFSFVFLDSRSGAQASYWGPGQLPGPRLATGTTGSCVLRKIKSMHFVRFRNYKFKGGKSLNHPVFYSQAR